MKIDMKIDSGPAPEGAKAVGIIKIGDGEFTICYDSAGGERPEKFESTEENGCFMFKIEKTGNRLVQPLSTESGGDGSLNASGFR